jgi:hypothetical protein
MLLHRRASLQVLQEARTFWIVHYFPAEFAHADSVKRKRHARVRSFLDPLRAAFFTSSIWHSPHWRLLAGVQVCRTGSGFEPSLPF